MPHIHQEYYETAVVPTQGFDVQGYVTETMTQHHTMTQPAIHEMHVEQQVIHETHVAKEFVHERHIDQPVIHERHIDQPVVHERHIDQPVVHERHYEQPVIHQRHIDQPIIHERHIDKPIIHEKHIEQPVIHERHYEQPIVHEQHIYKPVVHEVHVNQPVIHDTIHAPARVEIQTRTEQTFYDQNYTSAAPIVMNGYETAPARVTVERTTASPIMHTVGQSSTMTSMYTPAMVGVTQTSTFVPGNEVIVVGTEKQHHRHGLHSIKNHLSHH